MCLFSVPANVSVISMQDATQHSSPFGKWRAHDLRISYPRDKSRRAPCRSGCLAKYNQVTVMTHGKASSL
ncbi:hypothetical protein FF1_020161 [Malus domestica]